MIAIIDYGLGNISNVTRAIQHLGYDVILTCNDKDVQKAEAIVPIQSSHPIPHLGWNELKSTHPLLQSDVYFVHSYQA